MIFTKKGIGILILSAVFLAAAACVLSWLLLPYRGRITDNKTLSSRTPASGTPEQTGASWQFSSPAQEKAFYDGLWLHSEINGQIETSYGRAGYDQVPDDHARLIQNNWERVKGALDQQDCELVFGKEFFALYLQYFQDVFDGTQKYLAKDFDGAMELLRRARVCAGQLKKTPMQNAGKMPALCVDKMAITISFCEGVAMCRRGDLEKGLAALRAAYDEAAGIKWREGKAQAAYYMALYAERAKAPYAKTLYQQALREAKKNEIPRFIAKCCFRLGLMNVDTGNYKEAMEFLQEASNILGFMRSKIEGDIQKAGFENDNFQIYRLITTALITMGKVEEAFELYENVKSRGLQDLLRSKRRGDAIQPEMDRNLLLQEQTILEQIEDLKSMGGKNTEAQLAVLQQKHNEVLKEIRRTSPDYGLLKIVESTDLRSVQALLDDQTVLLEYPHSPEHPYLVGWLVTKNSIRMEQFSLASMGLPPKVQAIRMMIGKPKLPAAYKLLGQLYEFIIKPFEKDIQGKNLILVPGGALHQLPFAALMDGEGKFLVEKHAISVVPSFTILKFCMATKKSETKTILAFGNPDLNDLKMDLPNAEAEVRSISKQFPSPGPVLHSDPMAVLPNAEIEVKGIAEKFPQTKMYLRKEATETLANKLMGKFDILHFACHGEMDQEDAMRSCLRLAPGEGNDGKLEAGEIFDLKLNAQMVILSGCETGRGELTQGEEMFGLTRSFIYAGTPAIIASLWKVDDNATSLLMTSFYKNLSKMGKAEALRQAQIQTMKVKKHPYYWAAFYLVGDGR